MTPKVTKATMVTLPAVVSAPRSLPEGPLQPVAVPVGGTTAGKAEAANQPSYKSRSKDRMAVTESQAVAIEFG